MEKDIEFNIKNTILKNQLIRYKILAWLYQLNQENRLTGLNGLCNNLNYKKDEILPNLKFLKKEGLITYKENLNKEPVLGWGTGVKATADGLRFIEEIKLSKKTKGKQISQWIKSNASWIVLYIPKLIELIHSTQN